MKKCLVILSLIFITQLTNLNVFAETLPEYHKALMTAYKNENWTEMIAISDSVIKYYPKSKFGYFFKGLALDLLGDYKLAIKYYSAAAKLAPTVPDIYQNRALAYLHDKQYDKAVEDYDTALKLDPDNKLAQEQREYAINAKSGFIVTTQGNITNYQSINDPFYLATEYKNMPQTKKDEYINSVKIYSDNILPIYYIAVAEDLFSSDKNLAAFLYAAGRFRSVQDVAVCKDTSAYQAINILPEVAPNTSNYIANMSDRELANLLQKVLDWDEKHSNRPDPKWICYHGIEVFSNKGKVSTIPKDEWDKNKNTMRESTSKYIEQLKVKNK